MPSENNSSQPNRTAGTVSAVLLIIAAAWCIYWFVHAWQYIEDDAYIHLEFARSVAAGHGFAFNGHVVAGDTAPLWVLLLAVLHTLIPNWLITAKVLSVLGAIFGLTATYAFARRLSANLPGAAIFPAAVVLLVVVNPYSCYWLFSGMEPLAAAGVAFFAVLAVTRPLPTAAVFLTGCLLAGIAPLLRPEMFFLAALLALPLLGQWMRLPSSSAKAASFAAGMLLLATPVTLWLLYSLHAFGHILPNTNAAKRAAPGDSVPIHLLSIYSFGHPLIVCGLLAGIVFTVFRPRMVLDSIRSAAASVFGAPTNPQTLPLAGWLFILWPTIATVFYIVNHTYVQTRYILVTAPALTIVILTFALRMSRRTGRILYAGAFLAAVSVSLVMVRPFLRNKGIDCEINRDFANFMREHLPLDAPVAAFSIGQLAFDSEHPIVDTGGITRPGAIPYLYGSLEEMAHWAQSQGAQYYIEGVQPEPGAVSVYTHNQMVVGWSLHAAFYAQSNPVTIWKLPPYSPAPPEQPAGSQASPEPHP